MKTIFDKESCDELLDRLGKVTPDATRQWGKMSPVGMMEHAARVLDMATNRTPVKQVFVGKMLGWIFRKQFLGEKPFGKNAPTGPDFIVKDEPDFEATRERLKSLIMEFHDLGESGTEGNIHRFFGPLTGKQWGETQYKHLDHHFRQFGV